MPEVEASVAELAKRVFTHLERAKIVALGKLKAGNQSPARLEVLPPART
jgi:hypothetical protein